MKVVISAKAEKQFFRLPRIAQIAITKKIRVFEESNEILDSKKLKGYKDLYRVRVGHFRIVFTKFKGGIHIVAVGHRREVYEQVGRVFR